jgi:hypothetical protein
MAIHVTAIDRGRLVGNTSKTFDTATGWVVDDNGRLHVTETGNGNVATYNAGEWVSAERDEETK